MFYINVKSMKKYLCVVVSSLMLSSCASSNLNFNKNLSQDESLTEDAALMEDAASMEDESYELVQVGDDIPSEEVVLVDDGSAAYLYKMGVKYDEGKGVAVDLPKAESYYKQAMDKGSLDATNALGVLYLNNGNYDQAKKYFEKAAAQNDEIANYNLGNMSFLGKKAALNPEAVAYYKKSASKNYAPAYVALGDMYATGKGVTFNVNQAEEYYLKAADLNDDVAIDRLALLYLLQDGVEVDSDETQYSAKTVKLFQRVAEKGNPKALYVMSLLHQNGYYVEQDQDKAVELLKKSAELKHPEAEYSLAYLYLTGMYVEKDYKKGVQLMTNAANNNFPDAQNNVGMLYLKGEIVPKDLKRAKGWLEKASANGSAMADYNLGVVYDAGMGIAVDAKKAGTFYMRSAELGYLPAFSKVVEMYATGTKGVEKSNEKARAWLDKAIDNDDSDAMLLKANAYYHGNYGYAKDMALAKDWLEKAKKMDNPNASTVENAWKRSARYQKFNKAQAQS